jgi:uncharacterized protein
MDNEVRGISFPFRIGGRGGVVMSGNTITEQMHIKDGLKQLFTTDVSERVMKPFYGLYNLDIFFDNLNESTKNMAIFKIREAVEIWEPRVQVRNIDIVETDLEDGKIAHIITLSYSLVDSGAVDTMSVQV